MTNQNWINENYPEGSRNEITKLDIRNKKLKGFISLEGFNNLKELQAYYNELGKIIYPNLGVNLTVIRINDNNFNQELTVFSPMINLRWLDVSNNAFFGSLKPLNGCDSLEILNVSNTKVDSDLEQLPQDLETIVCRGHKELTEKMAEHGEDYQSWRDENYELVAQIESQPK